MDIHPHYEKVKRGESVEKVMKDIAGCFIENCVYQEMVQRIDFSKYESIKQYIEPVLINTKANRKLLSQMPHEKREDLSLVYKLILPNTSENSRASVRITNEMIARWGIHTKELHEVALENVTRRQPAVLQELETALVESYMGKSATENLLKKEYTLDDGEMFVLSNEERVNGAVVLAYPDLLKRVDEKFENGYYILPSSIHECMIVPKRGKSPEELGEMVRIVNTIVEDREEILSDRVYEFDRERNCLCQVAASIDRGREMER